MNLKVNFDLADLLVDAVRINSVYIICKPYQNIFFSSDGFDPFIIDLIQISLPQKNVMEIC